MSEELYGGLEDWQIRSGLTGAWIVLSNASHFLGKARDEIEEAVKLIELVHHEWHFKDTLEDILEDVVGSKARIWNSQCAIKSKYETFKMLDGEFTNE